MIQFNVLELGMLQCWKFQLNEGVVSGVIFPMFKKAKNKILQQKLIQTSLLVKQFKTYTYGKESVIEQFLKKSYTLELPFIINCSLKFSNILNLLLLPAIIVLCWENTCPVSQKTI